MDYLDPDVAYLIGMIVGRGAIAEQGGQWTVVIEFPFINPQLEGYDQFAGFVTSIATHTLPRLRALLGEAVQIDVSPQRKAVHFVINLPSRHIAVRNFKRILDGRSDYSQFVIPSVIRDADAEIAREFMRGFADVAGNIRRSNRDWTGLHRVYLDVLSSNWVLPVQICDLLQNKLEVPVQSIIWGHPNLRDPGAKSSSPPLREHQIRIYAHDFLKVGFYIDHKQAVLKALAKENQNQRSERRSEFCPGYGELRLKKNHPAECDERLPEFLRGKHFDAYWQICAECGCPLAQKAVRELRRQQRLV